MTEFLDDHPGGDDLILNHAGKDVTEVMQDPVEHSHSDSAFALLAEYEIGKIGNEEQITRDDFVYEDGFEPEDTRAEDDYQKNEFLDLDKPLLIQLLRSDFSKSFYLQQVHQPRHLAGRSAKLFGPAPLEMFTLTPWYVVPVVWIPIALYVLYLSVDEQLARLPAASAYVVASKTVTGLAFGVFIWTVLEYTMHRFLFHIDDMLPDRPVFLTLHFLLHGVHHYLPMDRLRLVMPPVLFAALSYPFTRLAHAILPHFFANATIAGAFLSYVGYDTMHYALHHTKLPQYIKSMKSHHMAHHYANANVGFGVTSKVWDWVFGTDFPDASKRPAKTNALKTA